MTHLLREQFSTYDKYQSGLISKSDFVSTLKQFGLKGKGIKRISSKFQSGTSDVDYRAFLNYFSAHQSSQTKHSDTKRNQVRHNEPPSYNRENRERSGNTLENPEMFHISQNDEENDKSSSAKVSHNHANQEHHLEQNNQENRDMTPSTSINSNTSENVSHPVQVSRQRHINRDYVGNNPLSSASKLYLLKEKIQKQLLQCDTERLGVISKKQFKEALKNAGLIQEKSIKTLSGAFSDSKKMVDYHHFLSLVNFNSKIVDSASEGLNASGNVSLVTNNNGTGPAGKRKNYQTQYLDSVGSVLMDHPRAKEHSNSWVSNVAQHTNGLYSQMFEEFFKEDPVFTGYVDKGAFENTLNRLNIAPKESIGAILTDVSDPVSGRVDYNKFIQQVIEERRGQNSSPISTYIPKPFASNGGVKATDGGIRNFEQVYKSNVLTDDAECITEMSVSGVRKKALAVNDQIGSLFENESAVAQKNSTTSRKRSLEDQHQDKLLSEIRNKVYHHKGNLANAFRTFDEDHSGSIDYKKFKKSLSHHYGLSFDDKELKPVFSQIDNDNRGEVSFEQFAKYFTRNENDAQTIDNRNKAQAKQGLVSPHYTIATSSDNTIAAVPAKTAFDKEMTKLRQYIREKANIKSNTIHDLFRSLDKDRDGILSINEFRNGLESIGVPLSDYQFEHLVNTSVQAKKHDHISFEHFANLVSGESGEFTFHSHPDKSFFERKRGLRYIEEPLSKERKFVEMKKQSFGTKSHTPVLSKEDKELFEKLNDNLFSNVSDIQNAFRSIDVMQKGKVSREQFKRSMHKAGVNLTLDEYERLFAYIDKDRKNIIDYNSILSHLPESSLVISRKNQEAETVNSSELKSKLSNMKHILTNSEQLKAFVEKLDTQGQVRSEEFKTLLSKELNVSMDSHLWNSLMSQIDPKKTGEIQYSNFMHFINRGDATVPLAMKSNMEPNVTCMSTVDDVILGSTSENPYFRIQKKRMHFEDRSQFDPEEATNYSIETDVKGKYYVSDNADGNHSNTVIDSEKISPPSTPRKESKILRHVEVPRPPNSKKDSTKESSLTSKQVYPRVHELRAVTGRPISFKHLDQVCQAYDENGNGKVSQQHFMSVLNHLGVDIESSNVKEIANTCSSDNFVNYKKFQFVAAGLAPLPDERSPNSVSMLNSNSLARVRNEISQRIKEKERNLTHAFLAADVERKGYLSNDELQKALKKYAIHLPDENVEAITKNIGSKEGKISLKQFVELVKPTGFWDNNKKSTQPQNKLAKPKEDAIEVIEKIAAKLEEKKGSRTNAYLALRSRDGLIHIDKLGKKLRNIGVHLTVEEKSKLQSSFENVSTSLDFTAFTRVLEDQSQNRVDSPRRNIDSSLKRSIRKILVEGTQSKPLKLHEAFKAFDISRARSLEPQKFKQAIKSAVEEIPEWVVDRSIKLSLNDDGTCNYERFLSMVGFHIPEAHRLHNSTPKSLSPRANIRHQHHSSTSDLLCSTTEQISPRNHISPRRGIFFPTDSGDIIAHSGPVRDTLQLLQGKSRQHERSTNPSRRQTQLYESINPILQDKVATSKQTEDIQKRMNLSPRLRSTRYANSPLSRGNPLVYVEHGEATPSNAYQDKEHPDVRRRKRVIETRRFPQEQKLLYNSKARVTLPPRKESNRTELKHSGYEMNNQDTVGRILKSEEIKGKPTGIKTYPQAQTINTKSAVKDLLNAEPKQKSDPANLQSIREQVHNIIGSKFSSSSVAFRHLSKNRNEISIPNLQQHLSKNANIHISKKDLKQAFFGESESVKYSEFVKKMEGNSERSMSAPPARPTRNITPHKNFSRDIISFRF